MAQRQKDDIINVVFSVNASKAQQQIHDLTTANKDLTKANQERLKKMRELEVLGRKEQQSYKNLKAAYLEARKSIGNNNRAIEQLRSNLSLTNMSYSELHREAKRLKAQLDNTSRSLNSTEWSALNARLQEVRRSMKQVEVGAYSAQKSLCASIKEAVSYQVGLQSLVLLFLRLVGNIKDFVREGIRIAGVAQGIDEAFSRIANKDYLSSLREQTKGLLNDNFIKKFTVQANNLGIPIEHMGKLLAFAQQRAKDTGESVDYLSESIVKGLGRKSVLILDNLGLSAVRINEEFKRTGDFSAAVTKIVDEEMAKVGKSLDTAAEADVRRAVRWQNLQERIGGYLVKFSEMRSKIESGFVDSLDRSLSWIEKHWSKITLLFYSLSSAIVVYKAAVSRAIVLEKLHTFWLAAKRVSLFASSSAYALLTGNILRAKAAMRLLNIAMKGNLWGLVAAGVAAAGAALYTLHRRTQALTAEKKVLLQVSKKATEEFQSQAAKVDVLSKTIENNKLSVDARRAAIEKLKEIMPSYNATITEEGVLINHNTLAISEYLQLLEKQIKMKAAQEELEEAYRKKRQLEKQQEKDRAAVKKAKDDYDLRNSLVSSQANSKLSGSGMRQLGVGMQTSGLASDLSAANRALEKTTAELEKNQAVIDALDKEITTSTQSLSSGAVKTAVATVSLIKVQEELLEQAKLMPETSEAEIVTKNKKIESIEKEIDRLRDLGRTSKGAAASAAKAEKDRIESVKSASVEEIRLFEETQTRIRLEAKKQQAAGKITAETYGSIVSATEKASADFRLEQYRELYRTLENLEVKNGKDKKRALDEASAAILKSEEAVIDKRIALNASLAAIGEKALEKVLRKQQEAKEKAEKARVASKASDEMRQQFGLVDPDFETKMKLAALDEYYRQELKKYKDNAEVRQRLAKVYAQAKAKIEIDAEAEKLQTIAGMGFAGQLAAFAQELISLRDQHRQGLLEEQEYQKKKADLRKRFTEFSVKAVTEIASAAAGYMQEQEMIAVDQKYASEIAAAQGNQEKLREIEEKKEAEKLAIQKKYADINFIIKASEIIANTAVAVMRAMAELGPIAGPIAAVAMSAAGTLQLAVANQERMKVKNAQPGGGGSSSSSTSGMPMRVASGREDGGYIDVEREQDGKRFRAMHEPRRRGYVDRPTVIVGDGPAGRSREWVASNDALSNPTVAPIIRMLDAAQLSGQIRTIDMSAVLRRQLVGHRSGGYIAGSASRVDTPPPATLPVGSNDRAVRAMERFIDTMERAGREGIRSTVVLSELQRKQALVDKGSSIAKKK
ncbi:TPA_asm: tail tape measure [Porphyromonas phage phage022a_WW2931]|uniref:Tail tape measure n=1 Tax=Porphyromonas phage phage022a_WW2931 TaxID=3154112 RepID=A0AAT9JEI0_9CAUD|nr:hypothetical protein [Porphyromonas gingivalis]PDP66853.1 hypothetical protein CLI78_02290 [Porphyromonas gingivalis]